MKQITFGLLFLALLPGCSSEKPSGQAGPGATSVTAAATGDAANGKKLIDRYACLSCHKIPGFDGPQGSMGPTLEAFARRKAIAGGIPNEPATIAAYLQNPQAVDPRNRMPQLGITEADARDVTAYLFTVK